MQRISLLALLLSGLLMASCNSSKTATTAAAPQTSTAKQQQQQQQAPRQGGPRQGGPDIEAIAQQLGLTEAQTTTFKEINERYVTKFRELRQSAGDDRQAMRSQMETLRASQAKEVNAILDKEQQKKYAALQAEMEEKRRSRGPGGGRPGGGRPGGGGQ